MTVVGFGGETTRSLLGTIPRPVEVPLCAVPSPSPSPAAVELGPLPLNGSLPGFDWLMPENIVVPEHPFESVSNSCAWAGGFPLPGLTDRMAQGLDPLPEGLERPDVFVTMLYHREADHLLAHLLEIGDIVTKIIVVEATETFSGVKKPLGFAHVRGQFRRWEAKIVHVVIDSFGSIKDAWPRETHSRAEGLRAVARLKPKPTDWAMLLDADEFPSHRTVAALRSCAWDSPKVFLMQLIHSRYSVACRFPSGVYQGNAFAIPWSIVLEHSLLSVSAYRLHPPGDVRQLVEAGWGPYAMLSMSETITKIEAFSHQEFNTPAIKNPDRIRAQVLSGGDLFGRKREACVHSSVYNLTHPPAQAAVIANVAYYCSRGWVRGDDCPEGALRGGIGDRDERP